MTNCKYNNDFNVVSLEKTQKMPHCPIMVPRVDKELVVYFTFQSKYMQALLVTAVDFNFNIRVKLRYNTTLGEYIRFLN